MPTKVKKRKRTLRLWPIAKCRRCQKDGICAVCRQDSEREQGLAHPEP
ncbi:hypothetical protein ACFLWR_05110 [Chloroflexota bacterium]